MRLQVKWAVNLVIADDHFIFLRGLCGHVWVNILTLSPLKVQQTSTVDAPICAKFLNVTYINRFIGMQNANTFIPTVNYIMLEAVIQD